MALEVSSGQLENKPRLEYVNRPKSFTKLSSSSNSFSTTADVIATGSEAFKLAVTRSPSSSSMLKIDSKPSWLRFLKKVSRLSESGLTTVSNRRLRDCCVMESAYLSGSSLYFSRSSLALTFTWLTILSI